MQASKASDSKEPFVISSYRWINLLVGVPILLVLGIFFFFGKDTRPYFREHPLITVILVLMLFVWIIQLFRKNLKNRIAAVIDREGIWLAKYGLYYWSEIDYCYFEAHTGAEGDKSTTFGIKLLRGPEEVVVRVQYWNVSEESVKTAIETYSGNKKVAVVLSDPS